MKLNPKCVRDTLIALEDMSNLNDELTPKWLTIQDFEKNPNTWDHEKNITVEKIKWNKIGMFITYSFENETLLEQTCISDIVSRMAKMK